MRNMRGFYMPLQLNGKILGVPVKVRLREKDAPSGKSTELAAETASLSGIANKGITLRICYLQRVRPAQHKPVGRVWGIFEEMG